MACAVNTRCPTFVDDLCGHTVGPTQTFRLLLFILAAGHAAGLITDVHTCTWLEGNSGFVAVRAILEPFPVKIKRTDASLDNFVATGLPGELLQRICAFSLGHECEQSITIGRSPCKCNVKTIFVPYSGLKQWQHALTLSPCGPGAVRTSGPYLGIEAGTCSTRLCAPGRMWKPAQARAVRKTTWDKAAQKDVEKTAALSGSASGGMRDN